MPAATAGRAPCLSPCRPATVRVLKAAGLTILIELAGAMVAVGAFVVAWIVR